MQKNIDIKNRVVDLYNIDTATCEDEIVDYLSKQMKVRFHSAVFNNKKYVFTGSPKDASSNSLTVNGFRRKQNGEKISVEIK